MQFRTIKKQYIQEFTFLLFLLLCVAFFAHAQDPDKPGKKMRIEIEVTEDGRASTIVQEIDLTTENVNAQVDELVDEIEEAIEKAMSGLDDADVEIVIRGDHPRHLHVKAPRPPKPPHVRKYVVGISDKGEQYRAFLGVVAESRSGASEDQAEKGALVTRVVTGSAAEEYGIEEGDVILRIDGAEVASFNDVAREVRSHQPGDEVEIELLRNGESRTVNAKLGEREANDYSFGFENVDWENLRFPSTVDFEHWEEISDRKVFLGIEGKSTDDHSGVIIQKVFDGSTAEEMNLEEGDIIHKLNGKPVADIEELIDALSEMEPGEQLKVEFTREGKKMKESAALNAAPAKEEIYHYSFNMDDDRHMKYKYVYRIEVGDVEPEQIRELNQKSGVGLDESNSLPVTRFTVAPNPSEGVFFLDTELEQEGEVNILVLDANGRVVQSNDVATDDKSLLKRIDLSGEDPGVYFITVNQNGKSKVGKVVKK